MKYIVFEAIMGHIFHSQGRANTHTETVRSEIKASFENNMRSSLGVFHPESDFWGIFNHWKRVALEQVN